eukprot:1438687-Rhodomonas_salina.1
MSDRVADLLVPAAASTRATRRAPARTEHDVTSSSLNIVSQSISARVTALDTKLDHQCSTSTSGRHRTACSASSAVIATPPLRRSRRWQRGLGGRA